MSGETNLAIHIVVEIVLLIKEMVASVHKHFAAISLDHIEWRRGWGGLKWSAARPADREGVGHDGADRNGHAGTKSQAVLASGAGSIGRNPANSARIWGQAAREGEAMALRTLLSHQTDYGSR